MMKEAVSFVYTVGRQFVVIVSVILFYFFSGGSQSYGCLGETIEISKIISLWFSSYGKAFIKRGRFCQMLHQMDFVKIFLFVCKRESVCFCNLFKDLLSAHLAKISYGFLDGSVN